MTLSLRRRRALGALSAAAMAGLVPALRSQAAAPAARITLAVGGRSVHPFRHLPISVAMQLHFFQAEGLEVLLQDHPTDAQALQALHRGAADVAAVGFENTLRATGEPGALRSLVLQTRSPQMALAVSVRAMPRYRQLTDLHRRKIGIPDFGSLCHSMASTVLAQAGVEPTEVQFVAVGDGARAVAALRAGQVHALCHCDPVVALLEHQQVARVVADARSLAAGQALFGGAVPGACVLAPALFLQQHAAQAQALVHGVVHALKWLQTAAPADIVKAVPPDGLLAERSLYLASLARAREAISPDGLVPDAGPEAVLRALAVLDPVVAARRPDLSRTYTQEFARKAKQKFSA